MEWPNGCIFFSAQRNIQSPRTSNELHRILGLERFIVSLIWVSFLFSVGRDAWRKQVVGFAQHTLLCYLLLMTVQVENRSSSWWSLSSDVISVARSGI